MLLLVLISSWVSMLLMNYFSFRLLSSTRAYLAAESQYFRACKNASQKLLLYLYTNKPEYFEDYRKEMFGPINDSISRVVLTSRADRQQARRSLIKAGNAQQTADDFIWLSGIYQFPFLQRALDEWKYADTWVRLLFDRGEKIHQQQNGQLTLDERNKLAREIGLISDKLTAVDREFTAILTQAIHEINVWLILANIFILLLIFGSSILKSALLMSSLSRSQKAIEQKNQLLNAANQELDRFVYSASHDLRAPLVSLKGLVNLAMEQEDLSEIKFYLNIMQQSIEKQDNFISGIIDFSRIKRETDHFEEVNLEELLDDAVNQHSYYYADHPLEIKKDLRCPVIYSDPVRLQVIFNNLISNAIKYCDPEKDAIKIKLSSYQSGNMIYIEIVDNGIGIGLEDRARVFDMFYATDSNRQGTGLGLYIVKESVGKLGGSIHVQSHLGMGTKFVIGLPLNTLPQQIKSNDQPNQNE